MDPLCALTVRIPPSLQQQLRAHKSSPSASQATRAFTFPSSSSRSVRDKPHQLQRRQCGSSTCVSGRTYSLGDIPAVEPRCVEKIESQLAPPRVRIAGQSPLKIQCGDADRPSGPHTVCCPSPVDTFSPPQSSAGRQGVGVLRKSNAAGSYSKDSFRGKTSNLGGMYEASSVGFSHGSPTIFPTYIVPPACPERLPPYPLLPAPSIHTFPSTINTIPGIILSCAHHTHLHRSLFPPSLSRVISPSSFGLLPTTILSTQIPQQSYLDLVTSTIQLEIPMLMYHLGRTGGDCAWSENLAARSLLASGYTAELRASRRRKRGAVCEDTVIGDCVLLRWDKKPLTVEHVEGIVEFLRYIYRQDNFMQDPGGSVYFTRWLQEQEEQARSELRRVVQRGERKRSLESDVGEAGVAPDPGVERGDGKLGEGYTTPSDAGYESGEVDERGRVLRMRDPVVNRNLPLLDNSGETRIHHWENKSLQEATMEPNFPRKVVNRKNFEAFWRRYCQEKIQAGVSSWIMAKNPYEI